MIEKSNRNKNNNNPAYFDSEVIYLVDKIFRHALDAHYTTTQPVFPHENARRRKVDIVRQLWGISPNDMTEWRHYPGSRYTLDRVRHIEQTLISIFSGKDYNQICPTNDDLEKANAVYAHWTKDVESKSILEYTVNTLVDHYIETTPNISQITQSD